MLPVTEVTDFLIKDLEPEAAALLYLREMQWLMAQVPGPTADDLSEKPTQRNGEAA